MEISKILVVNKVVIIISVAIVANYFANIFFNLSGVASLVLEPRCNVVFSLRVVGDLRDWLDELVTTVHWGKG